MGTFRHAIHSRAALCTISSLLFSYSLVLGAAGRGAPNPLAASSWPKSFVARNGAAVVINQPQIAEWPNQSSVTFYSAVSYRAKGAAGASLGTIVVDADTTVAFRERLVHFSRFAVVDANFPTLAKTDVEEITLLVERMLPPDGRTMRLDEVLAAVDSKPAAPKNAAGLKADPPQVLVSKRPAVVVNIDGAPVWRALPGTTLRYVVNTNWDLFHDSASQAYFLRSDKAWLTADNVLGPWTKVRALPAAFNQLPAGDRFEAAKAANPASRAAALQAPIVFVTRQPAELIVLDGEPAYRRVPGTAKLNWVSNTDSNVFREGPNGTVFYLVSGRWFAAPDFSGPWTYATPRLPADFLKIPVDHPRSHVLASVPSTPQAAAAVRLAQIPHSARVNKKAVKAPTVAYDGTPAFTLIPQTPVGRAVNTDKDVLKAGRFFYLCFDGVWFVSNGPAGPWRVTGAVPSAIYQIPPSSPAYRVTYVTVDEDREDWTVFKTTPGYTGTMVAGNSVVWGTGYNYAPYIGGTAAEPVVYELPATYGTGAWYNPWTASFGRGRRGYGPSASMELNARLYEFWDPQFVLTADRPRDTFRATAEPVGTSGQLTAAARVSREAPVFAGRDGSVYRQRASAWEKYGGGGWVVVSRVSPNDAPILRQLDDDARARAQGSERSRAAASLQNEWGARAASYRPPTGTR
jgi:hypothetical protein